MARTVLIVDDAPVNRQILNKILENDYTVLEAENGREAMTLLMMEYKQISAVLLDIIMPEMDGFAVLGKIRQNPSLAQIPVIVMTGSTDRVTEEKALALGATDFVTKPFAPGIVRRRMENLIRLRESSAMENVYRRDRMTGLWNRESFFERAERDIAKKPAGFYVIGCVGIDSFKLINDRYGIEKGDEVLKALASALQEKCDRSGGLCGRIFADNFVSLFPRSLIDDGSVSPDILVQSVRQCIDMPVTFSVGRYIVEDKTLSASAMYDRARLAQNTVKGRFDQHVAVYDEPMRLRLVHEQEIVGAMKDALAQGHFEAWFQPQYNHNSGALIGAEALARWRHPEWGLVSPMEFIPAFERNGFIYEMDKCIWEQVCNCLRKWIDEGRDPLPVSVNISRYDLFAKDLVEGILALIDRYEIPAELLRLEVTESAFAGSAERVVSVVKQLIDSGFTVEIDDFGSGYSSLNTLKDVPAQILKLDMRFMESGTGTDRGGNILESVVRMSKWLGMSVIAEGVETLAQADYLRSIGCCYIQGYLYAKPIPLAEYEELAASGIREERLMALETVEHLDNNAFWDPASMDTLIFNSFVGAACIFEYHDGKIELIRVSEKYVRLFTNANIEITDALKMDWAAHMDDQNTRIAADTIRASIEMREDAACELVFHGLPNCPPEVYLRFHLRVIATTGDRYLVYATYENMTAQREAELRIFAADEQMRFLNDTAYALLSQEDPQVGIRCVLQKIREHFGADRAFLLECGDVLRIPGNAYEDCAPGVSCVMGNRQGAPSDFCRLRMGAFSEDCSIRIDDVSALPEDLAEERALLETQHIASMLAVPFRRDGNIIGFVGVDNLTCRREQEEHLRALGDYLAAMLNRCNLAAKLVLDAKTMHALMDNTPGGFGLIRVLHDGKLSTEYVNESLCRLRGMTAEEIIAAETGDALSSIHPDDVDRIGVVVKDMLTTGEKRDVMFRLSCGDGSYASLHAFANLTRNEAGEAFINVYYTELNRQERADFSVQAAVPRILSALMESSTDMFFAKDLQLRYLSCSDLFARLAGFEHPSELIGRTDSELIGEERAEAYAVMDRGIIASGEAVLDALESLPQPDGELRYVRTSKFPLRDANGTLIGIFGIGRDVTDVQKADDRLKLLANSIPGGIASYTVSPAGFKITYFNDGFCKMIGCTRQEYEELSKVSVVSRVFAEDLPHVLEQVDALYREGTPIDCTYRNSRVDGPGYVWIHVRGELFARRGDTAFFNTVLFDVTREKATMEALRVREEEYRLAMERSDRLIYRYNHENRSVDLTGAVAQVFGLPPCLFDVPESLIADGIVAEESVGYYRKFYSAMQRGDETGKMTIRRKTADGRWRWFSAFFNNVFDNAGRPTSAIVVFHDVTEELEKEAVYKRWQQSIAEKKPEDFTLFCWNLSRDTMIGTPAGALLHFRSGIGDMRFNARTLSFVKQYVHPEDRKRYTAFVNAEVMLAHYYRGKRPDTLEFRCLMPDQGTRWLRLTVELVEYPGSVDVCAYMMYENIDQTKKQEMLIREQAQRDPLTGLLNRVVFAERFDRLARETTSEFGCTLLMLDLDGFKQINDSFGHAAGDRILIDVANALCANLRADDLIGRLGGDEFLICLSTARCDADIESKARQLCTCLHDVHCPDMQLTVSIGIAVCPRDGGDFHAIYRKADAALYSVKGAGKDSFAFYRTGMDDCRPDEAE